MIYFTYTGKNSFGVTVQGKISAINRNAAQEELHKEGITVVELDVDERGPNVLDQVVLLQKPRVVDLIVFANQMYAMLKAGVPIIKAINTISDSCKNQKLSNALANIAAKLEAGYTLGQSIAKYHKIFPKLVIALVNIGEQTGTLDKIFAEISVHLAKENDTKKRIAAALRYPTIVLCVIGMALIIMNIFIIPSFANFFAKFHTALPLPTRILIATSHFFVNYWWVVLLAIAAAVALWISYINTTHGRLMWDRSKVHLPLVGSIIERSLLSRFSRSFALCFRSGMPLLEAMSIIAATCDNAYMEKKILEMKDHISRGESMAVAARNTKLFNSLVLQMILIGEESGELDRLLDEVSDFYEQELDYDIKQLSSLIEPILIAVMGGMVLILALGIFLPMWELSKVAATNA